MALKTKPFDAVNYLTSAEHCAHYLTDALESNDVAEIADAIGIIARARGMAAIARKSGFAREALYVTLSRKGNPEMATLLRVLKALDLQLVVRAGAKPRRARRAKPLSGRKKAA